MFRGSVIGVKTVKKQAAVRYSLIISYARYIQVSLDWFRLQLNCDSTW